MDPLTLAIFGGSALMQLLGGKKSANAARDAARIQAESGRQANQALSDQWGQTQQTLQPYLATGQDALMSLAGMVGLNPRLPQGAPVGMPVPGQRVAPQSLPTLANAAPGYAGPQGPPHIGLAGAQQVQRYQGSPQPTLAQAGQPQGGQFVLLRAPNGQTARVPASQAQHYLSRGAQVIG